MVNGLFTPSPSRATLPGRVAKAMSLPWPVRTSGSPLDTDHEDCRRVIRRASGLSPPAAAGASLTARTIPPRIARAAAPMARSLPCTFR